MRNLRTSLVLAVTAAAIVLAGCGNSKGTVSPTVNASRLKPYDLLWYMRGRGPEKDEVMIEEAANKYLKSRINATIRIVNIDRGAYERKMTASIASGEYFDMCFTASWTVNLPVFAQRGAFVPLNDPRNNLLDKYLTRTKEELGPFFLQGASINGILYAIPVNKEHAGSFGMLFRKDIVDRYKLDVSSIKSWDALERVLLAVRKAEPLLSHPISVLPGNSPSGNFVSLAGPAVIRAFGDDTKVHDFLELPDTVEYYQTMRRFYREDLIRKDAATTFDYVPDVQAGRIFAISTVAIPGADKSMENQTGMPWVMTNWTQPIVTNDVPMGAMNAISVTSKDPARAAMFMEIINTDTYLNNLINFGIEGVHYVKVSDKVIDFAPGTDQGRSSGYNPGMQWGFANQLLNYLFPNEDPDKWARIEAYNKTAVPANSLGFFVNVQPIKNELAAMSSVYEQYVTGLEVGSSDPARYVPLAIAAYKAAGLDKVIQEVQKQFDAWRAARK